MMKENVKEEKLEQTKTENFQKTNKRNKWKFIITGFLIIIALGVGLYFGYNRLSSNPIIIYKNAINELYSSVDNIFKDKEQVLEIDALEEPFKVDVNARIDSNIEELKAFNNLNYNLELAVDYKNEMGRIGLGVKSSETILDAVVALIDKNVYLKSNEIYNKTLNMGEYDLFKELKEQFSDEKLEVLNSLGNKDFRYLLKEYKDILIKALDKDKFQFKKDKITIDGEEKSVKRVTYILDEETIKEMAKVIVEEILGNKELLEKTASLLNKSTKDLEEDLKEFKENDYNKDSYQNNQEEVVIYADNFNNVVALSFISLNEEVLRYEKLDDNIKIEIKDEEANITLIGNQDKGEIKVTDKDTELTFSYEAFKKDVSIDVKINNSLMAIDGSFTLENMVETKDKAAADFKVSFQAKVGEETQKVALQGDFSLEKSENLEIDKTDSVYYKDLSSKELKEIQKNLKDVLKKFNLTGLIS